MLVGQVVGLCVVYVGWGDWEGLSMGEEANLVRGLNDAAPRKAIGGYFRQHRVVRDIVDVFPGLASLWHLVKWVVV